MLQTEDEEIDLYIPTLAAHFYNGLAEKQILLQKHIEVCPAKDELEVAPPILLRMRINQSSQIDTANPRYIGDVLGSKSNQYGQHVIIPFKADEINQVVEELLHFLLEDDYVCDEDGVLLPLDGAISNQPLKLEHPQTRNPTCLQE